VSRTKTVSHEGRHFWVFDEALGIWLKYLIEVVERRIQTNSMMWAEDYLEDWRVKASISDLGWHIGVWADAQKRDFLEASQEACDVLAQEPPLPLEEVATWSVLDDIPIVHRTGLWDDPIDVEPIVELGRAVMALIAGTLDDPPPGTWWLFGGHGGRKTIAMRVPWDYDAHRST
jgi:hypothetical protein